ncbi:MAG: dTDP-4-dehydrorhamnose reductase [Saprospiraceae bacterium]|nr:dTDP-4-dehydrorhamnose reductase [Saprospiraceae bacterium]
MKKVLVTGGNGQLGNELRVLSKLGNDNHQYFFTDVEDLDITNESDLKDWFSKNKPDQVINCAAYTAVDKAEENSSLCYLINQTGAEYLAKECNNVGARMIQISTDYVYHNEINRPLQESDPTHPQSVYANSKLEGDLAVLSASLNNLVIRTSWVYSSFGHNFVKTMIRLGQERDSLNVVCDQIGTPTYARHLAQALITILSHPESEGGIYHFSNEGVASWYDFATAIMSIEGLACQVFPIPTEQYPTPAARPLYSVLSKEKIKGSFDLTIPHWREGLKECLSLLKKGQ